MFCTCTANDVTDASGASVPTTKAGPVTAFGFTCVGDVVLLVPLQPASSAESVSEQKIIKGLQRTRDSIRTLRFLHDYAKQTPECLLPLPVIRVDEAVIRAHKGVDPAWALHHRQNCE